jgi:hypothetical protein
MTETIRRRPARLTPLLLILGVFALLASALLAPAAHAAPSKPAVAAAPATADSSITEDYKCPVATDDGTTSVRNCNGTWWAGTPGSRTFQMYVTIAQNRSSLWESVGLQWMTSLDGRQKDVKAYCQYKNGTSSALKGHYIVGGAYPNTNSLGGTGRFYCDNYSTSDPVGYIFNVTATYGSGTWSTIITVGNPWIGGVDSQYGHPERWCSC